MKLLRKRLVLMKHNWQQEVLSLIQPVSLWDRIIQQTLLILCYHKDSLVLDLSLLILSSTGKCLTKYTLTLMPPQDTSESIPIPSWFQSHHGCGQSTEHSEF